MSAQQVQAEEWNTAISRDPHATYLHTYQTAQFEVAMAAGARAHFFFFPDRPILGLQIPWFAVWMPAQRWPPFLQRLAARMGSILLCRGDLAAAAASAAGPEEILTALETWAQGQGVFRICASGPPSAEALPPTPPPLPPTYRLTLRATIMLHLEGRSLQQLWRGLAKNARNSVRRAERQSIEWIEATAAEHIDAYYRIRCES
ncbi:MAG: hypothetical protein N3A66_12260, partial [Planctomycetota bacterium]|nr:hypothetical protein [Planctomycetota bacterium]